MHFTAGRKVRRRLPIRCIELPARSPPGPIALAPKHIDRPTSTDDHSLGPFEVAAGPGMAWNCDHLPGCPPRTRSNPSVPGQAAGVVLAVAAEQPHVASS